MRAARGPTERQAIQSRCPPILPTRQADQSGNGRRAPRAARGAKPWAAGWNVDGSTCEPRLAAARASIHPGRMELEHDD